MSKKILFTILIILVVGSFGIFWLYRAQIFSKQVLYLEVQGPDTAKMGEEVQYIVKYKNQGNFILQDPVLVFRFPDNVITADGKTRVTKSLDDLLPGSEQYLAFKARLLGKENDLQAVHVSLAYTPKNLSARYESDTTFTTKIESVPITLTYDLPTKIEHGQEITYDINYFSNVDYLLQNISIKADFVQGFTIKSATPASLDKVEWKIGELKKGQGGRITITGTVDGSANTPLQFSVHLGMRLGGRFVILKDAAQEVGLAVPLPKLSILQLAESSGSEAPGAYTIIWQVKNDVSDVKNVKVKAILPTGATINDYIVPEDQASNFSFDTASRQIVWVAGDLSAGAQAQIAFQITPGLNILGMSLLGAATVSGDDQVTGTSVQSTANGLNIP